MNHQPWDGSTDAYIIGLVAMDEQHDLRLMTNVVDLAPDDVCIGMPVEVVFEDHAPVHLPLFRPAPS
ncbi:Zn-ribbon domain-containing OB-fold protein [Mycobacterium sp. M23085]|uniref:Zn-ribbon domain-containing OB-fold protein n=1 Tax=Mycobacterium sp. M23085 TaxID=3378087 RepID=UPI003877B03A